MDSNNKTITPEMSEIAGIFAADGSMQKEHICLWGNIHADRGLYDNVLKTLFLKEFDIEVRPHEKRSNSVYGFYVCNKMVIEKFRNLGFPIGKKTYSVKVPEIIYNSKNKEVMGAFIRGFFAGDGCLNFDKKRGKAQKILKIIHTYPRLQIKCVSRTLVEQLKNMLIKIGLTSFIGEKKSKKENECTSYMLEIDGAERLDRWVKEIGFSNPNHSTRYEIFKRWAFVPSNTTYAQRLSILKGELDPWSFYPKWVRGLVWIRRQRNGNSIDSLEPSKL